MAPPYRGEADSPRRGLHYGGPPAGTLVIFATNLAGRIDSSIDGGLTWVTRTTAPAAVYDIAFAPDLNRAVAPCAGGIVNKYTEDGITFSNGVQPGGIGWQRIAYGGPAGDRRFIMVNPNNVAVAKFAWSATGIGGWTNVTSGATTHFAGCVIWDDVRQLWLYGGYTFGGAFEALTSPTGDVWTTVFTGAVTGGAVQRFALQEPGGRITYAVPSAVPNYYSDDPTFAVWTADEGLECPAIAVSPSLWFKAGPGAPFPGPGRYSPSLGLGTWTSSAEPFIPGSQSGIYIPELTRWVWMSLQGGGPTTGGLFIATGASAPNLGSGAWTRTESDPNWNGSLAYGIFT